MEIYLRPFIDEDWDSFLRWHTELTKWAEYDAPWEEWDTDIESIKKDFLRCLEVSNRDLPGRQVICCDGKAVGSVNSYFIDGDRGRRAIGIGIYDDSHWGKGIGEQALGIWIDYWRVNWQGDIYCQTWSGNLGMMRLAEKVGFVEMERAVGSREVRGKLYDNITYVLQG